MQYVYIIYTYEILQCQMYKFLLVLSKKSQDVVVLKQMTPFIGP